MAPDALVQFGSSRETSHSQRVSWSPANILQHLLRDTSITSPFHLLPCFLMALLIALEAIKYLQSCLPQSPSRAVPKCSL